MLAKDLITNGYTKPPDVSKSVQAFADSEAKRILEKGQRVEPTISADLRSLETKNMTLIGEDYRFWRAMGTGDAPPYPTRHHHRPPRHWHRHRPQSEPYHPPQH